MNIRSNIIDRDRLEIAAVHARKQFGADIYVHEVSQTRGRSMKFSLTFYAYSLHGRRHTNRGDGELAASWSDYGILIAELFDRDPDAIIGQYKGRADFVKQCTAMHVSREQYHRKNGGTNPYGDIQFLSLHKRPVSS